MTIAQALLSFAGIAALLTIIPGLDTALVLRSAISRGRSFAFATALGINTGALAWGVAAAVGASALLAASTTAYTALKIAGAVYLGWLGVSLIRNSFHPVPGAGDAATDSDNATPGSAIAKHRSGPVSLLGAWARGAGTNLLNPKVGVFYIAMIPQFMPSGVSHLLMGTLLAGVHNLLGIVWFTMIIFGTHLARRWLQTPRVTRILDRVTGGILIAFGVKLAADLR